MKSDDFNSVRALTFYSISTVHVDLSLLRNTDRTPNHLTILTSSLFNFFLFFVFLVVSNRHKTEKESRGFVTCAR